MDADQNKVEVSLKSSKIASDEPNRKSIDAKRDLMKMKLETNFPLLTTLIFALVFIEIGLAAIALQIGLVINMALNHQIGNGFWGGIFAIVNGLIKLNMCMCLTNSSFFV